MYDEVGRHTERESGNFPASSSNKERNGKRLSGKTASVA